MRPIAHTSVAATTAFPRIVCSGAIHVGDPIDAVEETCVSDTTFAAAPGTDYYVYVDGWLAGYNDNFGPYILRMELTP